jgi:hypothetical protein
MTRPEILAAASRIVTGEREQQYNSPEQSFDKIAALWGAYLSFNISAVDVACMMALLKIARVKTGSGKEDNWIDLAGYAACGGELEAMGVKES